MEAMLICPGCLSLGFVQMFKDIWSDAMMMSVVVTICAEYRHFTYSEYYMYNMCDVLATTSRKCFLRVTLRVCQSLSAVASICVEWRRFYLK